MQKYLYLYYRGFEWVSGELGKLLVGTSITYAYQYNALNAAVRLHPNLRQTTLHVKNIHVPTLSSWPRCNEPRVREESPGDGFFG